MTNLNEELAADRLGTLLRERAADHHPDVNARLSAAVRTGVRMRRRRRLTVTATGFAGVAAAAVVGTQLWTSPPQARDSGGFATAPVASPSASSQTPDCASFKVEMGRMPTVKEPPGPTGGGSADGLGRQARRDAAPRLVNLKDDTPDTNDGTCTVPAPPPPQNLPVTLQAPGWTCDPPADDKFTCNKGPRSVLVVLRPAEFHDDYLTDPDKATPGLYVSDIHGDVLATIDVVSGSVDLDQLATRLIWD